MIAMSEVRKLALGLPEAVEQDHHGMPSFRVRGKIFATVPDPDHIRVMVEEADSRAAVDEDPVACEEFWRRRAPRRLVEELGASSSAP
jgi:hypothetical protein